MRNKLINYIVTLLLLSFMLTSCFEDLGNYNYKELPSLKIDTLGVMHAEMTAFQFEKLTVPVKINYEGDKSNLAYEWKLYPQSPTKDEDEPNFDSPTILSNKEVLDTIIYATPNKYYLVLTVTDKKLEISDFVRVKLNVETKLSRGIVILDKKNGINDLNLIRSSRILTDLSESDDNVYYSLFTGVNKKEIDNGKFLGYASRIKTLYFFTDKGGYRLNENTFEIISEDYKSMFSFPMSIKGAPRSYMETSRPMQMIVDNGLIYKWDHMAFGVTTFGDRLDGNYNAAPFLPRISTNTFSTVIFDDKNKRFAPIDQFGTNVGTFSSTAGAAFDINNIGATKELIFMDNGFNAFTYSVFRDTQSSNYDLYVSDFSGTTPTPVAIYPMNNCPGVNKDSKFTFANRGNLCFYCSGSDIYHYRYATTNTAEVVLSFAGETITGIRVFKQTNHINDGKLLLVSTANNNSGKVYLIEFNELNGAINKSNIKSYDGFGEIEDILIK